MSLFRLVRKNIQNYAAQRLKQFIWIATSTMLSFFIISVQSDEVVREKIQYMPFFVEFLYYVFILLFFVCGFVTYQVTKVFLKTRKKEFQSYETVGMEKRRVVCLLCQEQVLLFGGALFLGLIHGMLFLKLFAVIFIKVTGVHGISSVSITIYALSVTALLSIVFILVSMWQCYRFIYGLKGGELYKTEEKA
ncbi:FtsX-like permease family protein [Bacillus gaemokensis]|uniref:ABC transporter permease n=1 Tax=Bacillus gaemokensis TaxID=574375 RepID=A0A073K9F4_9BACI|nr:ABC transporter permease [Bacillus gaemokensis]KEK23171.1 ABC transporter permease [Bacillus gaemokensis]KYG37616.1 ABC transporter permease [Bacillus gaemokensis]